MSQRIRQFAFAILATVAAVGLVNSGTLAGRPAEAALPGISEEAQNLIDWGKSRYADAGLTLPDMTINVFDSLEQCGGRVGRYEDANNILSICRLDRDTMLHELAHAWNDHNLTEVDHADFLVLRNLDAWNDRNDHWESRGSEHAAEIIVWALSDEDKTVRWVEDGIAERRLLSIADSSPDRLAEAYEQLTGQTPSLRTVVAEPAAIESISPEAR